MTDQDGQRISEPNSALPKQYRGSPWLAIAGVLAAFLLLIVTTIFVGQAMTEPEPPENRLRPFRAAQELPDGSLLLVKEISVGTSHAFVQKDPRTTKSMFGPSPFEHDFQRQTMSEQIVVWLERFSLPDLRSDDCSWWRRTSLVDAAGREVFDSEPRRDSIGNLSGHSTTHRDRPFAPIDPTSSGMPEIVAVSSIFPLIRHSGPKLTVRVYGEAAEPLAELEVDNPLAGRSFPTWVPDPLPIAHTIDDVTLVLHQAAVKVSGPAEFPPPDAAQLRLEAKLQFQTGGQPTDDWTQGSLELSDALGNKSYPYQLLLPPGEAAWKLSVEAWRKPHLEFPESQTATLDLLTLPDAGANAIRPAHSRTAFGVELQLLGIGRGPATLTGVIPKTKLLHHIHSGSFNKQQLQLELQNDGRSQNQITVDYPGCFLVATIGPRVVAPRRTDVLLQDPAGRDIPVQPYYADELVVWFFDPPEDCREISVRMVVQEPKQFEFLFVPPELPSADSHPTPQEN